METFLATAFGIMRDWMATVDVFLNIFMVVSYNLYVYGQVVYETKIGGKTFFGPSFN